MKTESKKFPLLTIEILAVLEETISIDLAEVDDLELIDHYMNAVNGTDIKEEFLKEKVYSFEHYLILLKDQRESERVKTARLTGYILGCLQTLRHCLKRGEKIY